MLIFKNVGLASQEAAVSWLWEAAGLERDSCGNLGGKARSLEPLHSQECVRPAGGTADATGAAAAGGDRCGCREGGREGGGWLNVECNVMCVFLCVCVWLSQRINC